MEGISCEPSAPYTQHQNGVSERKIRFIMEKARTMLLEAQLPARFWAEAVNMAVYLLNRSQTKALNGVTPFEAWHGRKPTIATFATSAATPISTCPTPCARNST